MKTRSLIQFLSYLIFSISVFGCGSAQIGQNQHLTELLDKLNIKNKVNPYSLIIPIDGCGPCFEEAIKLAKENTNNSKINFLFTTSSGFKVIKTKFSSKELTSNNFVMDPTGIIAKEIVLNGHLLLLKMNGAKVIDRLEITPENVLTSFSKLDI